MSIKSTEQSQNNPNSYQTQPDINTNKYVVNPETLATILAKYDISNFTYKESLGGIENTTIFVFAKNQNFVLRVYRAGSKTDEQIQTEIDFIYFLRENDFSTPDIFANKDDELLTKVTIDGQEWQFILMEKIYTREIPQNEWVKDQDLLQNMAQTQAKLHLLGAEFAQISLDNDYDTKVAESGVGKTLSTRINQLKETISTDPKINEIISNIESINYEFNPFLPFGYIHDDIDWNNLLIDDNDEIFVIDFGDLRVGPLVSCLGSGLFTAILSAFELGENIQNVAQKYIDFYSEVRELTDEELVQLYKPIVLTLDLFIVTEILLTNTINTKVQSYLKLKNEVLQLVFKQEDISDED